MTSRHAAGPNSPLKRFPLGRRAAAEIVLMEADAHAHGVVDDRAVLIRERHRLGTGHEQQSGISSTISPQAPACQRNSVCRDSDTPQS
jgi:hypothetical protein